MGNVCCGSKEESKKGSVLSDNDTVVSASQSNTPFSDGTNNSNSLDAANMAMASAPTPIVLTLAEQKKVDDRLMAMRREQARLDLIVQATGRGMVAVRSTRGSNAYYDQGFAAALASHLEQTTRFIDHIPTKLPSLSSSAAATTNSSSSVYAILSQPPWQQIQLGNKGAGLAGCEGENPSTYLDHVAESFLDMVEPKKEHLFRQANPMVENLL
jgi:hypothetical protein